MDFIFFMSYSIQLCEIAPKALANSTLQTQTLSTYDNKSTREWKN